MNNFTMFDMFPWFMMFTVFCIMAWIIIEEGDRADNLQREKSELIKLRNIEVGVMRAEIKDRDEVIRELRDCSNQNDQCTIWECNCI